MCQSKRFAIRVNKENRELIKFLFHGIDSIFLDRENHYLMFTINTSGQVANRKFRTEQTMHDEDECFIDPHITIFNA